MQSPETLYFLMYPACTEVVVLCAIGPFWLTMVFAPVVGKGLLLVAIARRLAF